jgi:hypothetical protein
VADILIHAVIELRRHEKFQFHNTLCDNKTIDTVALCLRSFDVVEMSKCLAECLGSVEVIFLSKIWGFHGGDYEECVFCDVTPCGSCKNRRYGGT